MKKIFTLPNLGPLLLVVYITKSFIVAPSLFDFGVIALMTVLFIFNLKTEKGKVEDRQEIETSLELMEAKIQKEIEQLKRTQDKDRMDAETKFSTINLSIQRPNKQKSEKNYGWGR